MSPIFFFVIFWFQGMTCALFFVFAIRNGKIHYLFDAFFENHYFCWRYWATVFCCNIFLIILLVYVHDYISLDKEKCYSIFFYTFTFSIYTFEQLVKPSWLMHCFLFESTFQSVQNILTFKLRVPHYLSRTESKDTLQILQTLQIYLFIIGQKIHIFL